MNKKQWILAALSLILTAAALISGILIRKSNDTLRFELELYFFNEDATGLLPERRTIHYQRSQELVDSVLQSLIKGPSRRSCSRLLEKNTSVNSILRETQTLTVDFSDEFLSDDSAKNTLRVYAVVKTLSQVPGITMVQVTVNSRPAAYPDGRTIAPLSGSKINLESDRESAEFRYIVLYFATADGKHLSRELRRIKITDTTPLEQYVVNELIKGPEDKELSAVLTSDTGLISAETTDGTCFVNLKGNFVSKNLGSADKEKLAVYSIVNSLTELDQVQAVQFLIDGKKSPELSSKARNDTYVRDESLITE